MQHDAGYCGFIDYFRSAVGLLEETEKMVSYMNLAQSANWLYPYKNIAIISDRPMRVTLNENGVIHNLNESAICYRDGFEVFALDGVRIPKEILELVHDKSKSIDVLKIENAEHRLLAIKYHGIDNLMSHLPSKSISKKGTEYELFSIEIDGEKEKLLKMKNPSEDKWHYEFVPPEIKTVNSALAWRVGWGDFKEPKFKA